MVPADSAGISRVPLTQVPSLSSVCFSPTGAVTRCGSSFQRIRLTYACPFVDGPTTPVGAETPPVWALARSLATTCAIVGLLSFPPGTEMFQFPGLAPSFGRVARSPVSGCPIRTSADHRIFAPTRSFSQLITSFVASESQGILHVPFSPFFMTFLLGYNRCHIPDFSSAYACASTASSLSDSFYDCYSLCLICFTRFFHFRITLAFQYVNVLS